MGKGAFRSVRRRVLDKYEVLKKYFGYTSFKEGQEELVDSILTGRDVLGIMPTGAGKSICYQVPALCMEGITIVVSPLISLMMDQVKALNQAGVHAAYINSSLTENQITKALQNARMGQYKIIYVAPERLETERFLYFALNADISMVTIDEAHCISQWGQDFRPSYLKILQFIDRLPVRPIVSAFTATATMVVRKDILEILNLQNPKVLVTGFDRENLFFEVRKGKNKDDQLLHYLQNHLEESGIIYCATRKNVEKVCEFLEMRGLPVTKYHAGLSSQERKENQEDFIYDRKPIVVATNDASSLRDAQHTVMELSSFGTGKLHLVVNRVRKKLLRSMHATIDDAIDTAGLPLLGVVPEDDMLILSLSRGIPLLLSSSSLAGQAYKNIAARITGKRVPLLRIK